MENSIVKIKRKTNGSGYPLSSEIGELAINLFDKSFYIINGSSVGITFGTQIDNSSNLIANSDNRICTESSIISYASSMNISGGYSSLLREASNSQTLTAFLDNRILFENSIFNNISGLNYSGGTFTNSSGSVIFVKNEISSIGVVEFSGSKRNSFSSLVGNSKNCEISLNDNDCWC